MKIRRLLQTAALAALLHLAPSAAAPKTDACKVTRDTYRYLQPNAALQAQNALAHFGLYTNRFDGIVGVDTRAGFRAYCHMRGLTIGSTLASRQTLVDTLVRDATIDRVYPGWRGIVSSAHFKTWTATQQDAKVIRERVSTGTPAQVIDIISRYLNAQPKAQPLRSDNRTVSYQLTADDFAAIAARHDMLKKLAKLKGAGFKNSSTFVPEVKAMLKGSPGADTMLSLVEKSADTQTVFLLTAQGLTRLRAAGVPAAVTVRLGDLEYPGYTNRKKALQATHAMLTGKTTPANQVGDSQSAPAKPVPGDIHKWETMIASQLDAQVAYRLSSAAWQRLVQAAGAIPGYVPAMLQDMKGADYPLRRLFLDASQNRILSALTENGRKLRSEIDAQKLTRLDEKLFKKLEKSGFPAALAARLAPLKGKTYPSSIALDTAVDSALRDEAKRFVDYGKYLAAQARKQHAPGPDKAVSWSATGSCQCLPTGMKHLVYGFYPYWMAGTPQPVDFGSLSRIGYYAVGFNKHGAIRNPAGWGTRNSRAFALAKRYESKLDLVVTKGDWSAWASQSHEARVTAFKALAKSIAARLNATPDDALSRLKPYISLGTHHPVLGDGVTLFFRHYPEGAAYVREFRDFIKALRARLTGNRIVNIMLPRRELGKGIFNYTDLARWAQAYGAKEQNGVHNRMLLLVLLSEPYTTAEENLRRGVEENLTGFAQRNLLRMLIPVLVPDGHGALDSAIIYAGDNFGGVGFWPLPSANAGAKSTAAVKADYYPANNSQLGGICRIVCPNRWLFRLAFDLLVIVSLGALTVYFRCCECRPLMRRYFIPILAGTVVPLVLVGMSMLGCDPFLSDIATGNMPLFLVLLAIIIYAVWSYRRRRQKLP